ncbi:hypothetical protein ACSBR2_008549 [Camellia fascicularis]
MSFMTGAPGMCTAGVDPIPSERLLTHTEARVKHLIFAIDRLQRYSKGSQPSGGTTNMTIKVNEVGHGWLYESVIIKLRSDYSTSSIKKALKENGLDQVEVRERGGRDVVLTFKSQEELKSNIHSIKEWFQDWSQFILEWKLLVHIEQKRCVWLRCQEESISSKHTGIEDCSSNVNLGRVVEVNSTEVCYKEKKDEAEMAKGYDQSGAAMASLIELAQRKELTHCYSGEEVDTVVGKTPCDMEFSRPSAVGVKETMMEECAPCPKSNDNSERPGINLEVDLAHPCGEQLVPGPINMPYESQSIRPNSNCLMLGCQSLLLFKSPRPHTKIVTNGSVILSIQDQGQVRSPAITLNPLRNAKKTRKKKAQMKGFSRFARLYGHKAVATSKHTSKSIIFRPTKATLAQLDVSYGDSSSHNYLLKKAKATVQLGKSLGINFRGKEDVMMDKIIDLELKDKERIIKDGKAKL